MSWNSPSNASVFHLDGRHSLPSLLGVLVFEGWPDGSVRPLTHLTIYVQSLEPTWRKERTTSHKLLFDLYMCDVVPVCPNTVNTFSEVLEARCSGTSLYTSSKAAVGGSWGQYREVSPCVRLKRGGVAAQLWRLA